MRCSRLNDRPRDSNLKCAPHRRDFHGAAVAREHSKCRGVLTGDRQRGRFRKGHYRLFSSKSPVRADGKVDVVANDSGERTTPAVVNFSQHEICVGLHAKNRLLRLPNATVPGVKGLLGSADADQWQGSPIRCEPLEDQGTLSFTVTYDDNSGEPLEKKVTTEELITYQLNKLHEIALNQRQDETYPCVIAVPVYFSVAQRQLILKCAQDTGFHVLRIINEPTAATLAYVHKNEPSATAKTVLVYRLGGESSDVTVLQLVREQMSIVVSEHNSSIGGNLWTTGCAKYAAQEFKRKARIPWDDLSRRSKNKVAAAAERAKHVLSTMESCSCSAESVHEGLDLNVTLTRARFEMATQGYLTRAKENILDVLKRAGIDKDHVHAIVLSGGGCKMVAIQRMISTEFPKAEIRNGIPADEVIAVGAAWQAEVLLSRRAADAEEDAKHLQPTVELRALSKEIALQLKDGSTEEILPKGSAVPCRFETPISLGEDESSVRVLLLQGGEPLAKLVMKDLDENSNLTLTVEVSEEHTLRCQCLDKGSSRIESIVVG
ncbi:heat shock 70 kDa protein 14-like [Tropilaelaps mercedesae]|uniref:Heat shock 70 kDa protein 14-like n=1 Tax=Tropilaelaps mercedesae TaxID=418985 RepID=A0A1V9X0C7_9ACAR|nr:heat shock 70 kDa protein 14-like [Tropilaelaps mercedesae]